MLFGGRSVSNLKQAAHRLIEELPDTATWDDVMREVYERLAIERGLADSEGGRVVEAGELRAKYGLNE